MARSPWSLPLALLICPLAGLAPAGSTEPAPVQQAQPPPDQAASPAPPQRNIGGPGDYGLREKVLKRLSGEPGLTRPGWRLVLVNGGVVLSGTVPTWTVKRRALVLAGAVRGVINVTDQMQVPRGDVADEQIVSAIGDLLKQHKETLGLQSLDVEAHDGAVTLSGTVAEFATRVRAEELAGMVGGVTQITNRLRPADAPSGTDDASIRRAVVTYFRNPRTYSFSGEIEVQVREGRVTLTGRLPYYLARQQAGTMAALVGGVSGVDNRIKVDPSQTTPGIDVKELP